MTAFDTLLAPISEDSPCGEDISYNAEFLELEPLMHGKEETQFSEAVKPDFKLIHERCLELFKLSKHLRVATVLCASSLVIEGLGGAARALDFLSKLLQQYWEPLYPRLDPDDKFDPLERMNILSALTMPIGSFGDDFRFLERLREAPITASPQLGTLNLNELIGPAGDSTGSGSLDPKSEAVLRDTPIAHLQAQLESVRQAKAAVKQIGEFLQNIPGSEQAPDFAPLSRQLHELDRLLAPYAGQPQVEGDAAGEAPASGAIAAPASGNIQSRNDVVAALDRICAFYAKAEPSSPVPLLLQRAKRLVHGDFLTIMQDLAPESVPQLKSVTGIKDAAAST